MYCFSLLLVPIKTANCNPTPPKQNLPIMGKCQFFNGKKKYVCGILSTQNGCFRSKSILHGDSLLPVLGGGCRGGLELFESMVTPSSRVEEMLISPVALCIKNSPRKLDTNIPLQC